jgi:hypothetical protein
MATTSAAMLFSSVWIKVVTWLFRARPAASVSLAARAWRGARFARQGAARSGAGCSDNAALPSASHASVRASGDRAPAGASQPQRRPGVVVKSRPSAAT